MKLEDMSEEQFKMYQLKKIKLLLDKANIEFNKLPNSVQDEINDFHNSNHSLNHCLSWGLTACLELLEVLKE